MKNMENENDWIVEVKDLAKSYKDVHAVNGISFNVKRGTLFSLLGENGAGKSTTINILCSLIFKDSGRVFINHMDLDRQAHEIKKHIGIVFQHSVLDEQLTVKQNLESRAALYAMSPKETKERIEKLTRILELGPLLNRPYGVLSGGQRRRIDIARALIHEPDILFLDEPTTGLDPLARTMVWDILHKLMKERMLTIFLTTHYMEETAMADHIVIINHGKVVAEGTPDSLKNQYAKDTIRLIAPKSDAVSALLDAAERWYAYSHGAYHIWIKNAQDGLDFINAHRETFKDFEIIKGTMDDVFLKVTGAKEFDEEDDPK